MRWESPACRGPQELSGTRETEVREVHQDSVEHQGPREDQGLMVPWDLLVSLDLRESLELQEVLELMEIKEPWVLLVLMAPREIAVRRESRVTVDPWV